MAKVEPDPLVPDTYVRARGRVLIYQTRWGPKARHWPRNKSPGTSAGSRWRNIEFGYIAAGTANAHPLDYECAVNYSRGTRFVPRDVLMLASMGMLYEFHHTDGTITEGFRVTVGNVQDLLEQLTNVPGAMINRGPDFWEWISPGSENDVLTMKSGMPIFAAPAGGGGGGSATAYGLGTPVAPVTANFSAESDSAGTVVVTNQPAFGFSMKQTGTSGFKMASRGVAAPVTGTWTAICGVRLSAKPGAGSFTAGMYLRKTGNAKYLAWCAQLASSASSLLVARATSATAFSTTSFLAAVGSSMPSQPLWFRVVYDGTNYTFSFSQDRVEWIDVLTESKTAWLTAVADRIGFFVDTDNASATYSSALMAFDFEAI